MSNLFIDAYETLFRQGVLRQNALAAISYVIVMRPFMRVNNRILESVDFEGFAFAQPSIINYFENNASLWDGFLDYPPSQLLPGFLHLLEIHYEKEKDASRKRTPPEVKVFFDAFIDWIISEYGFHQIYDLAVGSGSLLSNLPERSKSKTPCKLFGFDIDTHSKYVSQALIMLSNQGIPYNYNFKEQNAITSSSFIEQVDKNPSIFIFDPPMSESQPYPTQWSIPAEQLLGPADKVNSEVLFLANVLLHAPDKSWYIGLFPENITFDSGKIYQNIRKFLTLNGLRFVVKLPTRSAGRILLVGQKKPASIAKTQNPIFFLNFNQVPRENYFDLLFHTLNSSKSKFPEPLQEVCQLKKWKVEELLKKNIFEMPLPPLHYQIPQLSPAEIFLKLEPLEENIQKGLESLKSALLETEIKVDEKVFISIKPPPTPFQSWKENIADSALKEVLENLETCLDRDGFISWKPTLALSNFSQYLKTLFELGFLIKEQETEPPSHWKLKIATEQQPLISSHSFLDFLLPPAWEPTENLKTLVGFLPKTQYEFYKNLFQDWLFRENNFPELERSISDIQVFEELGLIRSLPDPTPLSISIPELGKIVFVHPFFGSQWETLENDPDGHFGGGTGSGAGFIDGTGVG